MRNILFLVLFLSLPAFASNWLSDSGLTKAKSQQAGYQVYSDKNRCEAQTSEPCFEISNKDLRRFKSVFLAPNVAETADCDDEADCQDKLSSKEFGCDVKEPAAYDDKRNWPELDFLAVQRPDSGYFLWCQKKALGPDPAGSSQADADDAAKAADRADRDNKSNERDSELKQCVRSLLKVADLDPQTATTQQLANRQNAIKNCLGAAIKEMISGRLSIGDLGR